MRERLHLCCKAIGGDMIPLNRVRVASTLRLKLGWGTFMVTARRCESPQARKHFQTQTGRLPSTAVPVHSNWWPGTQARWKRWLSWAARNILSCWYLWRVALGQASGRMQVEPWLSLCDQPYSCPVQRGSDQPHVGLDSAGCLLTGKWLLFQWN